ncbi:MAG TPA: relaxase [Oxalobacteraceae bacterium]|nr:relaxase [Oxalobacteraceae bacterium]
MRSFSHLLGRFGLPRATIAADAVAPSAQACGRPAYIPPATDPGIAARLIDDVLGEHQNLIDRIKVCYGVDRPTFAKELLPLIRRYAECVHLLPATPDHYFHAPGGLLRLGLEVGFFSLQGTDGHIFSGRATISTRRHLEPRWRQATFLAGLCSELHRTLSHVSATNDQGEAWQPYLLPLSSWLARHHAERYHLKWLPHAPECRAQGLFILPHVVPNAVLQHLANGNTVIVPHMLASIAGMPVYPEHNILDDLVRRAAALVIDRDLRASGERNGQPQAGAHWERHLVDALRQLVRTHPAWRPNTDKSRLWYGRDGAFLVWPNAAADLRALLASKELAGIPKESDTMQDILLAAGVFVPQPDGQARWQIHPPGGKPGLDVVKLSAPALLFAGLDPAPEPFAVALARATPAASAPDPAAAQPCHATEQLPLPMDAAPNVPAPAATSPAPEENAAASAASPACPPDGPVQLALEILGFRLDAPMRLNPVVRDALARIVDTMNRDEPGAGIRMEEAGLFIALAEFTRRQLEPSLALRALTDAGMLAQPDGNAATVARHIDGEPTRGLLLASRFITGFNAGHAALTVNNSGPPAC